MRTWRDILDAAVDAVVEGFIFRPLRPMVGAGLASLPTILLGMWFGWDWLVTGASVLGYAVAAWALAALFFLCALLVADRWL